MAKLNECLIIWETGKRGSNKWAVLAFDAVRTESHSGQNTVTKYPVSAGFLISEHTIRENANIRLEAVVNSVSNPTWTPRQSYEVAFDHLVTAAGGSGSLSGAQLYGRVAYDTFIMPDGDLEKVQEAFRQIRTLVQKGTVIHVLTMRETYINCVMRSYSVMNDVTNAYAIPLFLEMEELVLAKTIDAGVAARPTSDSDGSKVIDQQVWWDTNSFTYGRGY